MRYTIQRDPTFQDHYLLTNTHTKKSCWVLITLYTQGNYHFVWTDIRNKRSEWPVLFEADSVEDIHKYFRAAVYF